MTKYFVNMEIREINNHKKGVYIPKVDKYKNIKVSDAKLILESKYDDSNNNYSIKEILLKISDLKLLEKKADKAWDEASIIVEKMLPKKLVKWYEIKESRKRVKE